jgi:hypothetical protein
MVICFLIQLCLVLDCIIIVSVAHIVRVFGLFLVFCRDTITMYFSALLRGGIM